MRISNHGAGVHQGDSAHPGRCESFVYSPVFILLIGALCWPATSRADRVYCKDCHTERGAQFANSVHANAITCQDCHGGRSYFEMDAPVLSDDATVLKNFDHGRTFTGKPSRTATLSLCGDCHADVSRMNAYGLRTDQLAAYLTSGHGMRLRDANDDRVAVCVDCHGSHDVLSRSNPHSRTYFANIADTCAICHANNALMGEFELPAAIIDQYRQSVHGRRVLERGDAGSPTCSTCHGSHGAVPPGFATVSHVCGKCHQQIENYFAEGIHGQLPQPVKCVACHGGNQETNNHLIGEATPSPETLIDLYKQIASGAPDPSEIKDDFVREVDQLSAVNPKTVCAKCHQRDASRSGHDVFFEQNDRIALERGAAMGSLLRDAQFEYAKTATRVEDVSRGVLIVQDEGILVEDAKTALVVLTAQAHTIDQVKLKDAADKTLDICAKVNASLDEKLGGLRLRETAPLWVWLFAIVFSVLMFRKYRALKHAMVATEGRTPQPPEMPQRRTFLDLVLGGLGVVAVVSILWPAISYLLPVRRRGGGAARVVAGKASEWAHWQVRKVSFGGKPVAVLRTPDGFRAFSAICPHLGCIVHWDNGAHDFKCPCHAASFDSEGRVVAGPPPKPLTSYDVKEVQGDVIISEAT